MRSLVFLLPLILLLSSTTTDRSKRLPNVFKPVKGENEKFESQGNYHSAHLNLLPHNEYEYYIVFEGGYDISLGTYIKSSDVYTFTWDSVRTYASVKDPNIYKQYYKYSTPKPCPIVSVRYRLSEDSLVKVER